jgi:DNA-binding transcriptional LysR family regulator
VLDELAAVVLGWDDSSREGAALHGGEASERTLVGIPTPRGLVVMLGALGWQCRFLPNLAPSTPEWAGLDDYRAGRRHLVLAWPKGQPDPLPEGELGHG